MFLARNISPFSCFYLTERNKNLTLVIAVSSQGSCRGTVRTCGLLCDQRRHHLTGRLVAGCHSIVVLTSWKRNKSFSYQDTPQLRSFLVCILNFDNKTSNHIWLTIWPFVHEQKTKQKQTRLDDGRKFKRLSKFIHLF